ncbi:MAG: DMT family transporter [Solobacterium sp.]|nr:DMT family transporter [Solobacterium sp.]
MNQKYVRSLAALLTSIVIWSASFIATKIAYRAFSPLLLCVVRFLIASILLFVIRIVTGTHRPLVKNDRRNVFLSALCGITIYYLLENTGVYLTSAGNASIITAVYPIATILIGAVVFHERVPSAQVIGILIAIGGIVVLTIDPVGEGGRNAMIGNLLMIFNGFMWGMYNYLTQRVSEETSTYDLTFYQAVIGTVLFLPVMVFELPLSIGPIDHSVLLAIGFLSAFCSVAAYFLYNYGLRGVSAGTAASLLNLMPVFGLVFSSLILHEPILPRQILGAGLVILGVITASHHSLHS